MNINYRINAWTLRGYPFDYHESNCRVVVEQLVTLFIILLFLACSAYYALPILPKYRILIIEMYDISKIDYLFVFKLY